MLETAFDSRHLPAADRVAAWHDITDRMLTPNEFVVDDAAAFRASLRTGDMGKVQVTALTYSSMRCRRTPDLIRRSDPGMYALGLGMRGRQLIDQERCEASLGARDLVLYSTSRPYTCAVDARQGTAASVVVQFPRAALLLPAGRADRVLATRLPGQEGIGGLLAGFLTDLVTGTGTYRPADRELLGAVLLDLITACLAHHTDAEDQSPVETRHRTRFLQVQAFINEHLADPELSPAVVAAAHHMSVRSLHRLFRDFGTTVASYIRCQRLTRVRRDLADPSLAARPIHATAARWGFPRPDDFTRTFRTVYGVTPSEYRHASLPAQAGTQRQVKVSETGKGLPTGPDQRQHRGQA
ncbi:helix-turn-helix domain-containing protein [Streptomyces sp. NPDC002133]|uniref:AraC-like ligand-binding domain-containing protein n=1 Tax=Streptomyces sp. NPDC002133 TaxID=3154409 RepID=UPI0033232974